eukprot:scaffold23659_cov157-Isochrysis_galbana.AAC.1
MGDALNLRVRAYRAGGKRFTGERALRRGRQTFRSCPSAPPSVPCINPSSQPIPATTTSGGKYMCGLP